MTISGTMIETYVSASKPIRTPFGTRCRPSAAIVPNSVARIALGSATEKLLSSAAWTTSSPSATRYQSSEKPVQIVASRFALKLYTTTTTIGRYRNA